MNEPTPPRRTTATLLAFLLFAFAGTVGTAAQEAASDEQTRLLELRQRQVELRLARSEVRRTEELFDQGLVSAADLERDKARLETAEIAYQQAVLALLGVVPHLSVREAVKYQKGDGRKFVRLTVTNLSPGFDDSRLELLADFEGAEPIPENLRTRHVRDVFLSLKAPQESLAATADGAAPGTAIALPYEAHVAEIPYRGSATLEFQLLREVSSVVVAMSYRGREQQIAVQLQQAPSERLGTLTSPQISQEADLGAAATYSLRLERSTVDEGILHLHVLNLPRQVGYSFVDPETQARLSRIHFAAGVADRALTLRVFLPEEAGEEVAIDQPLDFWAVVVRQDDDARFTGERRYTREEIEAGRAAALELAVIPRGVGRLEVQASSLYDEIAQGEGATTRLTLRNTGTRALDGVRLTGDAPPNWRLEIRPERLAGLEVGASATVEVAVAPPDSVLVGDYEVRIRTESFAFNRPLPTEDKTYRIRVTAPPRVLGTALLAVVLLALAAGIVVLGARLTRR